MAQIAAGSIRYAVRGPGGRIILWTEPIDYDILDNTAAPLVYAPDNTPQGYKYGTINDAYLNIPKDFVVIGSGGQMLEIQYYDASARTPATANFSVAINVAEIYMDPLTKKVNYLDRKLVISERCTRATSGTLIDPEGLTDNTVTVPNEWSPILRYKPAYGRNFQPRGRQRLTVDGV